MAALPQQGAAPLAPLTRLSLHTHKNSIPAFGVCTIFAGFHFIREVIPIAIYHCNISIVSRGKGKSAVAAAAYRSGEKLTNEWDGMTHDYTRKGGVVHTEIMLPPHAPPSFSDRSTLWNSVELYEKAGNAQLAREIDAALPIELSREEQIRLVREYCSSQFVSRGMCVDYAIHDTGKGNPHCHIMLTMRPLDERGAWAAKSQKEYDLDENGERIRLPSGRYKTHKVDLTGWNDKGNALLWRKAWADISNAYLERAGSPERIDHRSNAERGIGEIPTVHMGVAACQMEKKGIATEKGELNRNIANVNIKKHNPGMSDTQLRQLITAHIDEDEFCRYVIQRDINGIALALRETHKDDFFSVPEDNPLKEMLETAGEIVSQDSDTEQAYLAFICKRLKLNFRKLSVEERKWLKKIAEKSDLLKNPKPQRGRR